MEDPLGGERERDEDEEPAKDLHVRNGTTDSSGGRIAAVPAVLVS
jgi:hypothetical protein